jgi:kynurenine formamidase
MSAPQHSEEQRQHTHMETPSVQTVREMGEKYSNWGRWGADDQRGTLNFVGPEEVVAAAATIRTGKRFSLALPYDSAGPQTGKSWRFNPIHVMFRDGGDIATDTIVEDFYGGREQHIRGMDDMIIMPLQTGTQWDALSHILFDGKMYNGHGPGDVTSKGAAVNDITQAADRIVGRGVLLDIARFKGVASLAEGEPVEASDLEACAEAQGVDIRRGDFVLVRTGFLGERRGNWGEFAGGSAPGLALSTVPWICENQIAGIVTDTWGMEVRPNETPDVMQPLHCILIPFVGLYIGEIFDLEELGADCAEDGIYEFFFCAAPLPFTRAVGGPVNPIAVK